MIIRKLLFSAWVWCLALSVEAKDIYVSTSFHEPATEGLRFVYSYDGVKWDSIQGVFLRPEVGVQHVMRDPSIVKGPDGEFVARRQRLRLQLVERPDTLDGTTVHPNGNGHHDGQYLGTGVVL